MTDVKKIRAVIGAMLPLLSFFFVGSALISNDWYGGYAVRGTESEIGWWNASVEYDLFNATIWVGENDNMVGAPSYEVYVLNYTGDDQKVVNSSAAMMIIGLVFMIATLVLGIISSFRIIGGIIPIIVCLIALTLVAFPGYNMSQALPIIHENNMEVLSSEIENDIPQQEIYMLEDNISHGMAFNFIFYSIIPLTVSPFLFLGIKREKTPTAGELASNFYIDTPKSSRKRRKTIEKGDESVKGGSI